MISRKILIPLGLAVVILIPTIANAATTMTTTPEIAKANSARAPYATQIKAERQTIKANFDTNQAIRVTIKEKYAQVKTLIATDKANKTLKTKQAELKADRAVIKSDRATLKSINTNLTADRAIDKTDVTNKDYAKLVTDLGNIPSLQTSKTPILQNINSELDKIISLLNGQVS